MADIVRSDCCQNNLQFRMEGIAVNSWMLRKCTDLHCNEILGMVVA